jgi:hypothetical protein
MLANAIRFIGLWRIFINGGNSLYYVIVKQIGMKTQSGLPASIDIQALIFDLVLGIAIIAAAPAVAQMIVGAKAEKE